MKNNLLKKIAKASIIILPCSIFFSYHPLMYFGEDRLMHYELSLALIALVLFDIIAAIYLFVNRKTLKKAPKRFIILAALFPIYATLSILWSSSKVHGLLAAGIIWAIYLAVNAYFWLYKDLFKDKKFTSKFIRIFFGVSVAVCIFCWLQCIVDLLGVGRDASLMCEGCVYRIFGFPHPNGFMAEPQYLGGILLAPALLSLYLISQEFTKKRLALVCVFVATLFLSFSRGAIYAFAVASAVLIVATIIKQKTARALLLIPVIAVLFLVALNAQGLFAQFSKTDDTYFTGISKSLNQLSLGVIDISAGSNESSDPDAPVIEEKTPSSAPELELVDEIAPAVKTDEAEKAYQSGYIEASTNVRTSLAKASFALVLARPDYLIFGSGIGSGGNAVYQNYVDPGYIKNDEIKNAIVAANADIPSLNVQNEYAELALEFGLIGIVLIAIAAIIFAKEIWQHKDRIFFIVLAAAYLVAFLFCSGVTNSLYLYLFIPIFLSALKNYSTKGTVK
ncbi:MAG: O-antigen ligase family protein [Candidatus Saccharibacteria bacterium]|nr:O-antigen ligase family protein [Candidatus Saccharibacteria bacterium]